MLEAMPKVPPPWQPVHSIAYLLLCVALADGSLDEEEGKEIRELIGHYDGRKGSEADEILGLALSFFQRVVGELGRDGYLASVREHATRLANHYGDAVLLSVVGDMIRIAQADGVLDDAEAALVQAVADDWHLGGEA